MPLPQQKRFKLNMFISSNNCPIDEDIVLVKDKEFYTMSEISNLLGLNYSVVNAIYKGKYKKFVNAPCIPTIIITKINGSF